MKVRQQPRENGMRREKQLDLDKLNQRSLSWELNKKAYEEFLPNHLPNANVALEIELWLVNHLE